MRNHSRAAVRALLLALPLTGVGACDSSPTPPVIPASAPTPSAVAVQESDAATPYPEITIAPGDKVLVPPMSGIGEGRTPAFAIAEGKYTVRIACSGLGTTLKVDTGLDLDKTPFPCDETPRRLHVATDETNASLQIVADNATFWTVAVVVSDDFRTVAPSDGTSA